MFADILALCFRETRMPATKEESEEEVSANWFNGTFQLYFSKNAFWFRVLGFGLSISSHPLLFSERYGYSKVLRIGKMKFKLLNPAE